MPTFFLYALSNSTAFDGNLTNSIYTNNKYLNEDTAQQKQLKNDSWNIKNLVNAENSIFGNKNVTSVLSGLANIVFGGLTWSIGATALITIMTGGLALVPMLILVALAGTSALYGLSNMGEGAHQVLLGANGKGGEKSYNVLRDTVFQGNSELYHAIGIGSSLLTTGGMSGLSQGGTLVNMVKGMGKEVLKDAIGGGSGFLAGNAVYEATGSKILSGIAGVGAGLYAESSFNKLLNPVKNITSSAINSVVNDANTLDGGVKTAQSTAIQTYYPPNDGFLGDVVDDVLQPGTIVDRYGYPGGQYVAPVGTPAEMRALPPGTLDKPYNVYKVVEPINVKSGTTAPWFDQIGLGTQYKFDEKIIDLLEAGKLIKVN